MPVMKDGKCKFEQFKDKEGNIYWGVLSYRKFEDMVRDEWYYVLLYEDDVYYECDQFEGLLSLLKDVL